MEFNHGEVETCTHSPTLTSALYVSDPATRSRLISKQEVDCNCEYRGVIKKPLLVLASQIYLISLVGA